MALKGTVSGPGKLRSWVFAGVIMGILSALALGLLGSRRSGEKMGGVEQ